jgi:membrane protease YdiL (CAAX protease family)
LSGAAGSGRPIRIEGWSRAPLAGRLPPILLVVAVGLAAVVRELAPYVFIAVLFGYLITRRFGTRSTTLAAVLPAAAILVWRSLPQALADPTGTDCANLLAPPVVWRLLEGVIGLVAVAALLYDRGTSPALLGLRRGSRTVRLAALIGLLIVAPIAVYAGTLLGDVRFAGTFFGTYTLDLTQPLALLPALLFAASNALAEELSYRGAMRVWLAPTLGVAAANLAQSIVFGLSHTGADFVGLQGLIPTLVAMTVVGYVAGVVARRTGSLMLPLAIHLALDIPIYFYWACQLG